VSSDWPARWSLASSWITPPMWTCHSARPSIGSAWGGLPNSRSYHYRAASTSATATLARTRLTDVCSSVLVKVLSIHGTHSPRSSRSHQATEIVPSCSPRASRRQPGRTGSARGQAAGTASLEPRDPAAVPADRRVLGSTPVRVGPIRRREAGRALRTPPRQRRLSRCRPLAAPASGHRPRPLCKRNSPARVAAWKLGTDSAVF
jgi:hypothetical protein